MECCVEIKANQNNAELAEKLRLILGLLLLAIGIYIAAYSGYRGQGLGYLLIMCSPFLMLADKKKSRF